MIGGSVEGPWPVEMQQRSETQGGVFGGGVLVNAARPVPQVRDNIRAK